jgi:hypothetical protein
MLKQFSVRYGRNYAVVLIVLAIVLPCLLIAPFIYLMQGLKPLEDWKALVIIFGFLGCIISLGLWLVFSVYPPAVLSINNNEISLSFKRTFFLTPSNFSFNISDITSFTRGEIGGDEYFLFKTRNPVRTFQVSASSYSFEDSFSFDGVMSDINEMVNEFENSNKQI